MRYLFGLGNPGPKYVDTRHNFGFLLLERLAVQLGREKWKRVHDQEIPELADWEVWEGPEGHRCTLVWPLTFMNLSGRAVEALLGKEDVDLQSQVLVVIDELSLPPGRMRLRMRGSAGGHNGLKSVQAALGTDEYPRLKLGIGRPEQEIVDYVLSRFSVSEQPLVEEVLEAAVRGLMPWLEGGSLQNCVGEINGWRSPSEEPKDPPGELEPEGDRSEEPTVK